MYGREREDNIASVIFLYHSNNKMCLMHYFDIINIHHTHI